MPLVSRWGSDVKTVSRIDWICGSSNTKPRPLNHACHSSGAACPPISGPSGISASIAIPASGPSGISASVAIPASGPSGISASASVAQFNIAPIVSDQVALIATTPADGTIVNSSDTGALYIYDSVDTEWHHIKRN